MQLISEITRRDILDQLLARPEPFYGRIPLIDFLDRVFEVDRLPSSDSRFSTAREDITQHMIRNDDWSDADLLVFHLPLLSCDDSVFGQFLEQCVDPTVLSDSTTARKIATDFSSCLRNDGFELHESDVRSGHPMFSIRSKKTEETTFDVCALFCG